MRILIVDDEEDIRESLQEFFQEQGFDVSTACDGVAALSELKREAALPNVILLDLVMPRMNGNELYEALQGEPALSAIPIIVSTSDPSRAPSGCMLMRKPVNLRLLLKAVNVYCPD